MNIETAYALMTSRPDHAARMVATIKWAAANFDRRTFDRFTKDGGGGRVRWMRKPTNYPKTGLRWHDVRGRYIYVDGV